MMLKKPGTYLVLLIIIAAGAYLIRHWPGAYIRFMLVPEAPKTFQSFFGIDQTAPPHTHVPRKHEFAFAFGGTEGIEALDTLSQDPKITSFGQQYASALRDYILKGYHIPHLKQALHVDKGDPILHQIERYMLRMDIKELQALGVNPPETLGEIPPGEDHRL